MPQIMRRRITGQICGSCGGLINVLNPVDSQRLAVAIDNYFVRLRLENIGFIFQSYNLIPTLSCKENILLPTLYNMRGSRRELSELVDLLDIGHLLYQRVTTLSGGEKQRVAIARALILDPCLLLADEPTGNLDPKSRDTILQLLRHEHACGRGILMITHDLKLAATADTTLLLEEGILRTL